MRSSQCALLLACVLLAGTSRAMARTWIVAQDGSGDFTSVDAACEAASTGDSVLIRPGEYREEAHDDPMDPEILLTEKPLTILGDGPAETVSLQMKFGFVDCEGVVLANLRFHDVTGAITIWSGSYTIRSCRFEGNESRSYGGAAILCLGGDTIVEDSVFKGNRALDRDGEGGAIWGGNLTLRRCIFQDNQAAARGGAVYQGRNLAIEDCLFIGNAAPHGAAVFATGSEHITRSTFYRNVCLEEMCGAIAYTGDDYGISPDHCIIAETVGGAGMECPDIGGVARCCDFWENDLEDDPWCDLDPDRGNFSADPLFCDPEGGDFGLLENSPCLPGNHNGFECGLIGAGVDHCGIIPTEETTWGRLKTLWR